MSIWMEQLLTLPPQLPATTAATVASTRAAAAVPPSDYAWAIGQALALLAAGLVIYLATYGRRPQGWAPARIAATNGVTAPGLPLWVIGGAMILCFLAVPSLYLMSRGGTARPASDAAQVLVYGATCAIGLMVAAALHWAFRRARTMHVLGLVPLRATLLPGRAAVAAAIALPFTYLVTALSLLAWQLLGFRHEPAHAMLQLMERNAASPWVVWVTILNATLLAPVFEEVLFRGHLQTALTAALPRSRWPAIVISSLLFAMLHDAWTAPAIFALSFAIGIAYEWTGSLWVAIAIHVTFNAVSTAGFLMWR